MKKTFKYLFMVLTFICCAFTLIACGTNGEEILRSYIFEQDGIAVSKDFVLPGTIGGEKAVWVSDNNAVTLTKTEDGDYRATIGVVEEKQTVSLTVTVAKSSQTYTVIVNGIDVYSFIDNYVFVNDKKVVVDNFNLDSSFTYKGKTATIAWSVEEAYADYIEVDGNVCKVFVSSLDPTVYLKATFTYNGESATKKYRMTVSMPQSDEEKWVYWYNNTGITQTLSGYVVHKGPWTNYNGTYEAILYCVDDSGTFGFYLYNEPTDIDAETYKNMPLGTHITCTNPVNTSYSGLMETSNYKGKTTIDKDIAPIDVTPYAYDNDLLGKVPAYRYAQSKLVSLTNWRIKSIVEESKWYAQSTNSICTLEKDGVEITLAISKYHYEMEAVENDTNRAVTAKIKELGVGAYVTVEGVLGWYNAPQIVVFDASMINVGAEDTSTEFAGKVVGEAYKSVDALIKSNKLDKKVVSNITVTFPTTFNGEGTITYRLMSSSQAVKIEGGVFTITPGKTEKVHVRVEYSYKGYTTFDYFFIASEAATDAEIVAAVKKANEEFKIKDVVANKEIELPIANEDYSSATITWESNNACAVIDNQKGKVTVTLPDEEADVTLTATIHVGESTDTFTVTFHVAAAQKEAYMMKEIEGAPEAGQAYYYGCYQTNLGKQLYFTGAMDGNYFATSENMAEAALVNVEAVEGGFRLYVTVEGAKKYIDAYEYAAGKCGVRLADENAEGLCTWRYSEELGTLITTVAEKDRYIGTYKTFATLSASETSYISGDNVSKIGVSQFVTEFYLYGFVD